MSCAANLSVYTRIAELEGRADIDPLLEILNCRGFERELARAIAYVAATACRRC